MESIKQWLTLESYSDVRGLIFYQTRRFFFQYGGDFPELLAEAIYIFIRANHDFNPGGPMKFSTYVGERIWNGLIDYRKRRWRNPEPYLEDLITQKIIQIPSYSDRAISFITDLCDRISDDSSMVVTNILNPDQKLIRILRRTNGYRIERRALRTYLTRHHDWTDDRVDDAFWQISIALRHGTSGRTRKWDD